jgi:hypothetical protein
VAAGAAPSADPDPRSDPGAAAADPDLSPDPAAAAAARAPRASVCMHVPQRSVTAASLIAVLPPDLAAGAPLRAYVALGSPCVSIYVPAFVRTVAAASLFVPFELSTEVMWRAADALRERVDADPESIESIREVLDPVEEELWSEADDVVEHPDRWSEVGRSWGSRALGALQSCRP